MRAVLDTNVIVSAVLSRTGAPGAILRAWREDRFQLVTSAPLLDELRDVLARPRSAERHGWSPDERLLFIAAFDESAIVVASEAGLRVIVEDLDDDRVLEAAMAGEVDYIVSGDHHLLDLGTHADIPIVTPARFAAALTVG